MKTRHGFVSNSSSSSFIIALARKPETSEELHSWMFPSGPERVQPYDEGYASTEIAETAFRDISSATPMAPEEILEELSSGSVVEDSGEDNKSFPEYPHDTWNLPEEERRRIMDAYHMDIQSAAEDLADSLKSKNPGGVFFKIDYSDNDGSFYSCMEHGDVFSNISHVRISHH